MIFPWLKAIEMLAPLVTGDHDDPDTQEAGEAVHEAVKLAAKPPADKPVEQHLTDQLSHMGRIFDLVNRIKKKKGDQKP